MNNEEVQMKRFAMKYLVEWKNDKTHLPMLIKGARQVGKTWLMREFGRQYFLKTAYINLENNNRMKLLFESDFDIDRIMEGLSIESGVRIEAENTLIILDEIQEVPKAIESLKYFAEDPRSFYVIAAGSLLGVSLHAGTSFPVGKIRTLDLYPMSFREFLYATGNDQLAELLERCDFSLIATFRSKYDALLKTYYFVGGMPRAVAVYAQENDLVKVREIQNDLLFAYEHDFSKHAPGNQIPRIQMVWDNLPSQLAKENKKFIYSLLRKGARTKEYELAIQWLMDTGLVIKVGRVKKGALPLKAYADLSSFKLYCVDIGLLCAMTGLSDKTLLEGNRIFTEFKGAITEQYVCQEIVSELRTTPYYWSAENSIGEVDFLIQHEAKIIPIEVKAEENLRAKSLKAFVDENNLPFGIRTSMSDFREQEKLINIPLYAIAELFKVIPQ